MPYFAPRLPLDQNILWAQAKFVTSFYLDELLAYEAKTIQSDPYSLRITPSTVKKDGRGVKVKYELRFIVQEAVVPVQPEQGTIHAGLLPGAGISVEGMMGTSEGQEVYRRVLGSMPAAKAEELEDGVKLWVYGDPIRYFTHLPDQVEYPLHVALWCKSERAVKEVVQAFLPLCFKSDSPLPPPFLPRAYYTHELLHHITAQPSDLALSMRESLQPDSPTRTFFTRQAVFSSLPFFAALFATPSATVARRSSYEGRNDLLELVGLEAEADLAKEKEQAENADEEAPQSAGEDEEDEEMTPAPQLEGEEKDGAEEDLPASRPRSRSPSPSPDKPIPPSIRHFTLPDFTVASFEPFHAYYYERASAGKALSDFGDSTITLAFYRCVECFAPGSDLEDEVLGALAAKLTAEDAASLIFSPYTRFLPRYRHTLFTWIKDNLSEVRRTKQFQQVKKAPKVPEWKGALWAELADLTDGGIYGPVWHHEYDSDY